MQKKFLSFVVMVCVIMLTVPLSESSNENTVNFVKLLPDGSIERLEENIKVNPGQTLSQAISERCTTLLTEDERFQSLIEQQIGMHLIVSAGQGLHLAIPPALFEIQMLRISVNIIPSIVYCSYTNAEASTDIKQLSGEGNITSLSGPHKILAGGFIGIIGWDGIFTFTSAGFAGLTFFIWSPND